MSNFYLMTRAAYTKLSRPIARAALRTGLTPDSITILGTAGSVVAALTLFGAGVGLFLSVLTSDPVLALGALSLAKEARTVLEQVLVREPNALNGSAYVTLSSLYCQVPGWPIGFGDKDKARELLTKALAINPNGIDPHFFMGDCHYRAGDYDKALVSLETALKAPPRPNRPLADEGRRKEIDALLVKVREKLK